MLRSTPALSPPHDDTQRIISLAYSIDLCHMAVLPIPSAHLTPIVLPLLFRSTTTTDSHSNALLTPNVLPLLL